jgi:hypothetical protein
MDELLERSDLIEGNKPAHSRKRSRLGGFLDLLSGLLLVGTILVGIIFVILFINPHSSLNPLPPVSMPDLAQADTPSSAAMSVLSQNLSQPVTATDIQALPSKPIDIPMSRTENALSPAADLVPADPGLSSGEVMGQVSENDGLPASPEVEPYLSHNQVQLAVSEPISTEHYLTETFPPDEGISDIFTPEVQYWQKEILAWGEEYGLDPNLIATVMQIESCGYARAKSAADAKGLFQVMPHHFKKRDDPYDPDTNAAKGLSWLQATLKSGVSIRMALAGYNAGIARAKNPYLELPAETERYANWGERIYLDVQEGYEYSAALHHWLSKGGDILCDRAAAEQLESQ